MNYCYVFLCFFFCLFILSWTQTQVKAADHNNGIYIVYTGAASQSSQHDLLLSSLTIREEERVIHRYRNGFSGFAARLSEEEAKSIAERPGVVSVFPDLILKLQTTRSWDFISQMDRQTKGLNPISNPSSHGADTIIGIFDSGIWPESKSFDDKGMGPIPSRWKGTCVAGHDFKPSNCNRKLIGARYYTNSSSIKSRSARDQDGHGTHVAAIAAGNSVQGASYNGLGLGTARGGAPNSRIAVYRVCDEYSCGGSDLLKAFDDAIADGVDIISLSIGSAIRKALFSIDPIAIGAFHAMENGILVVCSAGNDGAEERESVINVAPWILTVGATTIDRDFETNVLLGGNKVIKGGSIISANLQSSPVYPLISGTLAMNKTYDSEGSASNCEADALDENKVKGKIVVCQNYDKDESNPHAKLGGIKKLGGIGMILIDAMERDVPSNYDFPMTAVYSIDAEKIFSYINSTRNPVATILPTKTVPRKLPSPSVALFSGTGPTYTFINIIKPDIVAPGVSILSAWPGNNTEKGRTSHFHILSGTSMACPHVSAIAALVKSRNPNWSPSAIKSSIMTTAIQTNNKKGPILHDDNEPATPFQFGAGQVSGSGPLSPGLVYDMEITDYLEFLCNYGYNISTIKLISSSIPKTFSCPANPNIYRVSNMNYPTILVSSDNLVNQTIKVRRTVTNVGEAESVYTAIVETPKELEVKVTPKVLRFNKSKKKLRYTLECKSNMPSSRLLGAITWTNGKYNVRSPIVMY
ncbi:hypothetical protein M9H77_00613 [Catharanthus roseus]|nr:hypothetical protein M9H77_00613 [Catharanthus roseus]